MWDMLRDLAEQFKETHLFIKRLENKMKEISVCNSIIIKLKDEIRIKNI